MKKLIFCYGTLKRGFSNSHVMGKSKLLGEAKIQGFTMHSLSGFPALTIGTGEIHGEVYEVTDEATLKNIYRLEGYSGQRNSRENWYDTADVNTPYGKAELFYMKDKQRYENYKIIENGIWQ